MSRHVSPVPGVSAGHGGAWMRPRNCGILLRLPFGAAGLQCLCGLQMGGNRIVRAVSREVGPTGVTVHAIAPPIVATPGVAAGPQGPMGVRDGAGRTVHKARRPDGGLDRSHRLSGVRRGGVCDQADTADRGRPAISLKTGWPVSLTRVAGHALRHPKSTPGTAYILHKCTRGFDAISLMM